MRVAMFEFLAQYFGTFPSSYFFETKKVGKKVSGYEESYDFAFHLRRRQKNSPPTCGGPNGRKTVSAQTVFGFIRLLFYAEPAEAGAKSGYFGRLSMIFF